jgi:hypothetical protein
MTLPGVQLAPPSLINPSPNTGQVIPIAAWPREPLPTDTKYPVGFVVVIGKNPQTGTQGDLWYLSRFTGGAAIWKQFSTGPGTPGIDGIVTNDGLPAVLPDVNGNVSFLGDGVFIKTTGQGPGSTVNIVPVAPMLLSVTTNDGAPPVLPSVSGGMSFLGDGVFIKTTGNGPGSTVNIAAISPMLLSLNVDANTAPGTDPVVPSASGVINLTGGQVAAATTANVIRSISLAANSLTIQIQRSKTEAASTVGSNGVCHFDANQFSVNSDGFVSLPGVTGTFTPGLAFGGASVGITYAVAEGRYTVLGNMVFFDVYIDMSSKGSSTGNVTITGFPINIGGPSSQVSFIQLDEVTYSVGFNAPFLRPLTGSSKTAEIWQSGDGVVGSNLNDTNFVNSSNVRAQGYYFV